MFQGQSSACVHCSSCGGSRHRRWPHTNTTDTGPDRIAVYSASCTHGVAASAVGPKFVGPAFDRTLLLSPCVLVFQNRIDGSIVGGGQAIDHVFRSVVTDT